MSPEKWKRAEELFHQALEVEPGERAAWLEAACGGDAELRQEVESLLASDEAAGEEFVSSALGMVPLERKSPERVGPYRVLRELGRGGMGTGG